MFELSLFAIFCGFVVVFGACTALVVFAAFTLLFFLLHLSFSELDFQKYVFDDKLEAEVNEENANHWIENFSALLA